MIEKVLRTFHNPNEPEGRVTHMQVGDYPVPTSRSGMFMFADCMDYSMGGGSYASEYFCSP